MPVVFVIRPDADLSREQLGARLRRAVTTRTGELALAVPPPRIAVLPFARTPFALVSANAEPAPAPGLRVEAYRVETTTPVEGDPRDVAMVTLFRRKPGLDDDELMERWHGAHSELAVRTHPLTRYVRHRVIEPLAGAPPLDGIVIEQVRERADLLRPWRFFGGAGFWLPSMIRVSVDAMGFIDMKTIENHLVEVEALRSGG